MAVIAIESRCVQSVNGNLTVFADDRVLFSLAAIFVDRAVFWEL